MIRAAVRADAHVAMLFWVLLLPLLGCGAPDGGDLGAASETPKRPAPNFELKGADGSPISLADHRGKPVGDVAVIGVAVDVEGASVVAPWIEEKGVEYQIAIGDEGLAREFGVMGFPTLAIINPDGDIESLHVGLIEVEELEHLVAPLIGSSQAHEPAL